MLHPLQILEQYWGHTGFRPNQQKIIEAVLENEDCLSSLKTENNNRKISKNIINSIKYYLINKE